MLTRRTILLKPMQPSLSGYARLQTDNGRLLLQLHARGLEPGEEARLYWYLDNQRAQEIARLTVNAHGEASAEADEDIAPQRVQAVILISAGEKPVPLLVGLCVEATASALLDVKNAALALCERLNPSRRPAVRPVSAAEAPAPKPVLEHLPREVFLPALDPAPYAMAMTEKKPEKEAFLSPAPSAPPADRLRPLRWPDGFESLKPYFEKALPAALFDMPGWRFVYAAHAGGPNGLWIGMRRQDGRVCGVAYAHRGDTPLGGQRGYRPVRGKDGLMYQLLVQTL